MEFGKTGGLWYDFVRRRERLSNAGGPRRREYESSEGTHRGTKWRLVQHSATNAAARATANNYRRAARAGLAGRPVGARPERERLPKKTRTAKPLREPFFWRSMWRRCAHEGRTATCCPRRASAAPGKFLRRRGLVLSGTGEKSGGRKVGPAPRAPPPGRSGARAIDSRLARSISARRRRRRGDASLEWSAYPAELLAST